MNSPQDKVPVLIVAGDDPTGNAGIQKDEQVCKTLGVNFQTCITAFTKQSDTHFKSYQIRPLESILQDLRPCHTLKIGMLGNESVLENMLNWIKQNPDTFIVWDPVFQSSSGGDLINPAGKTLAIEKLTKAASVVTPNRDEVYELLKLSLNQPHSQKELCQWFYDTFETAIYLKGGHFENKADDLFYDGKEFIELKGVVSSKTIRGTGCALSTALACYFAEENNIQKAVQKTKLFMNGMFNSTVIPAKAGIQS